MNIDNHKLYVTGDCHGEESRFTDLSFAYNSDLKEGDILFCCGDWGYILDNSNREQEFLEYLAEEKLYVICWVDGNHENFDRINQDYPIEIWNGGKVHIIRRDKQGNPKIIHLMRGQVFNIYGKKIFTFGGGYSADKYRRTQGLSWWDQEMPNDEEMEEGLSNLKLNDFRVDYILTHTGPEDTMKLLGATSEYEKKLNSYLEYIREVTSYERWFWGHVHQDKECWRNQYVLWFSVIDMYTGNVINKKSI